MHKFCKLLEFKDASISDYILVVKTVITDIEEIAPYLYPIYFEFLYLRLRPTAIGRSFPWTNLRLRPKVKNVPTVQHWRFGNLNFSDQFFFPDLNSIAKYRQHDFNSWNLDFSVKSRSWNCRIKTQCFLGFAAIFQIVLESQICTSKGLFIGLQIFIKAHWFFLIIRNP